MEADKTQKLLKEKLKEKGLKVTHQRLLVLSVLEENSGSHMTAEGDWARHSIQNITAFVGYAAGRQD